MTLSPTNSTYYENLGYKIPKYIDRRKKLVVQRNSQIMVRVNDLQKK